MYVYFMCFHQIYTVFRLAAYTAFGVSWQSYDLFLRNCNNFTHDLAFFLVGKGIPDHIRNLPETFLNTPFGQMMKPYIDGMLRGPTRGPESQGPSNFGQNISAPQGRDGPVSREVSTAHNGSSKGRVHNVTSLREVEDLLSSARSSCAVIFFTSSTCPPCKIVYPAYDQLAQEAGHKATLIKVDISRASDVSSKFNVRATPTFITFLKGEKENEWSGADEGKLLGNIRLLIQMAWPTHPHSKLNLQNFERAIATYVTYKKAPPLDKLAQKLGAAANEPALDALINFIKEESTSTTENPRLPDMKLLEGYIQDKFSSLPVDVHFAVIDLVRVVFADPRVSGYFAEQKDHRALMTLLSRTNDLDDCPYSQQLVMTQLACNLFSSPLYRDQFASHDTLRQACIKLATASLLNPRSPLRVTAASLVYNLAVLDHNARIEDDPEPLAAAEQVEIVASLLHAISEESESANNLHGLLLALGFLVHRAPIDGDIVDLCRAMDAPAIVSAKSKMDTFKEEPLLKEVGEELLGKGLGG